MAQVKDMTVGKPISLMIGFSIPLIISNVLQMLFTVMDSAIIGRILGVDAFAAVGATVSTHWFVFSAVIGLNVGFSTLIAQRFGAKDSEGLQKAFTTSIYFVAVFSIVIGIAGVLFCRALMELLQTPPELIDGAVTYLSWLWAGKPLMFGYNFLAMILFALGDSKTPLRAMIVATVVNIAFDLILIFPFKIAGVAAASLIAQTTAMIFCIYALRKTRVFQGSGLRFDRSSAWPLLRLALPLGFRNAVIEVGGLLVQRYVNLYGTEFVAGIAAAKRMYSLLMIAGGAIEGAIVTFVAQNFGAKEFERVKEGVKDGLKLALGSAVVIMAFTLPLSRQILNLLIEGDPSQVSAVLDVGVRQLWLMALGLPFLHLLFLYRAALQGLGNTFIPMLSGFIELILRIVSVVMLTRIIGDWGVLLSDPIAWPFAMLLLIVSYFIVFRKIKSKIKNH
ncbi:MAG: MATE family efflux transporter [Oscillospiraceae bacterium]|jgi:putative MATE family efflux protein|nr:MATE family efflux transporter [Oscillospiraceae bacterium]